MIKKIRLDLKLQEQFPQHSRRHIQSWIMQGYVTVNGRIITKAGTLVAADTPLSLKPPEQKYVSRAGYKLEHAIKSFGIDVKGLTALDAGLSTGGFTDCLLQHGASHIIGIDAGYAQVHEKIRSDPRVTVMERTNLRYVENIGTRVDIVTLDLSFISLLKVMDAVCRVIKPDGTLTALIKPQFEAQRHNVGRGGIVTNAAVHEAVIQKIVCGLTQYGFSIRGVVESPIEGSMGNKEFLIHAQRIEIEQQLG